MSTERAILLIGVTGALFAFSPLLASLVTFGLLVYAAQRERTTDDKSGQVSPGSAAVIFGCVGIWVIFCFHRALVH